MTKKRASKKNRPSEPESTAEVTEYRYRVLGFQPLSVEMEAQTVGPLSIQNTTCTISIRSMAEDLAQKLEVGGSMLAIEFTSTERGMLVAARRGMSLLEDFLSALALVTGSTFRATEPLQVARIDERADECEFLIFKRLPMSHWALPITQKQINDVRHVLAHWEGLEHGNRLRRAALQYREAIGNRDDTAAFQEAYIGLETLEPPLARAAGLTPGTEEVPGKCEACGHEFVKKRTSLVGVKRFVLNSQDASTADAGRKADWKLINSLRNDVMHGLVDPEELGERPLKAMLATMAHLHSAICLLSHVPDLVSDAYKLARDSRTYVICASYKEPLWSSLHQWDMILPTRDFTWVRDRRYGYVPQLKFWNDGLKDLEGAISVLGAPFSSATMASLHVAAFKAY